jgi:UDP-glucose 4-epimerase
VSGNVASFRELAELIAKQFSPQVSVTGSPRTGPMPHNGYRPFDSSEIARAFPDFRATPWQEGIAAICRTSGKHFAS